MPRTATIKAKENTTLLKLDKNSFDKYSPYDSTLREELEQTAHERIAQTLRRYKVCWCILLYYFISYQSPEYQTIAKIRKIADFFLSAWDLSRNETFLCVDL